MSKALLGETFDIHGGGLDLMFPHHENELAQSECCHSRPMVKYWLHNGLLRKGESSGKIGGRSDRENEATRPLPAAGPLPSDSGGKLSRSGGAGGLADEIARLTGERIRFFLLRTHYRSTVIFGDDGLEEAAKSLESFYGYFERFHKITKQRYFNLAAPQTRKEGDAAKSDEPLLKTVQQLRANFLEKMDDDFNTGGAIAELFDFIRELNKFANEHNLDRFAETKSEEYKQVFADPHVQTLVCATTVLRELTLMLGLFRSTPAKRSGGDSLSPKLMDLFIALRAEARAKKDFATGDRIRNGLTEIGVTLEDKKGVTEWKSGGSS